MLPQSFYARPALELAVALLGCELVHLSAAGAGAGMIVETEAYRADDPASHSFRGPTVRNAVMFGPAGHAYIYLSYGVHYCFNVVGGGEGDAQAVLIRALQPTRGQDLMAKRRGTSEVRSWCSGPGKLVQALGLSMVDNGAALTSKQLHIRPRETPARELPILVGPRIGITKASEQPWRFFIGQNPFVTSHRFNRQAIPLEYETPQPG